MRYSQSDLSAQRSKTEENWFHDGDNEREVIVVKGVSDLMLTSKSSERRYHRPAARTTTDVCRSEWEGKMGNRLPGRRGDIQVWASVYGGSACEREIARQCKVVNAPSFVAWDSGT